MKIISSNTKVISNDDYQWRIAYDKGVKFYDCFYDNDYIGYIPLLALDADKEQYVTTWWEVRKDNYGKTVTVLDLMDKIIQEHKEKLTWH